MKGFNLPFTMEIPVEVEQKLTELSNKDITYLKIHSEKILKRYLNNSSSLRKVADYLSDFFKENFMETLSYDRIAKELNLSEGTVKIVVGELAGWENYPFTIIASPKKKGYFQLSSKNLEDTENWITSQSRNIATREQRVAKTRNAILVKKKGSKKQKEKIKVKETKMEENYNG